MSFWHSVCFVGTKVHVSRNFFLWAISVILVKSRNSQIIININHGKVPVHAVVSLKPRNLQCQFCWRKSWFKSQLEVCRNPIFRLTVGWPLQSISTPYSTSTSCTHPHCISLTLRDKVAGVRRSQWKEHFCDRRKWLELLSATSCDGSCVWQMLRL